MPLEHWQTWAPDHHFREPFPVFDPSLGEEMISCGKSEPLLESQTTSSEKGQVSTQLPAPCKTLKLKHMTKNVAQVLFELF